ncbi:MAG: beta-N-acetylhexosaminidase [Bacteroidales bacterium]|nr:beta-N-acetylhexosaminidase [Bacteroidales bacterium]
MKTYLLIVILSFGFFQISFSQMNLIPKPVQLTVDEGFIEIVNIQEVVSENGSFEFEQELIIRTIHQITGKKPNPDKQNDNKLTILLRQLDEGDSAAYKFFIDNKQIVIESSGKVGIYYGVQTLLQILQHYKNEPIPQLAISDYPRFSWRGMHLDCSRHFFSVEEIKRYLDYLALYKMNVFHWHLTDDQGWRIEIKAYPELTKTGAWRSGTMVGPYSNHQYDNLNYGGYYTQDQIHEIVHYASQRHITVVPEIEMPGHSLAVLASYPRLACRDTFFEVGKRWGVYEDVFCAGNDSVFLFLENVLKEIMGLFPGEYIHIGGDECPKTRWKECALCQRRMQQEQLVDEHQLQSYFIQRIEKYLNANGRRIIGWDEILEGGLAPNAAVMSWRGTEGGIEAARMQHPVVMTPGKPCYFDHYQSVKKDTEPLAIGGLNTLEDVYHYNPLPQDLSEEEKAYILGAQGNVWTEYMKTFSQVEYMALPRMAALSEVLWSAEETKDYGEFLTRLRENVKILDTKKTNYAKHFLQE